MTRKHMWMCIVSCLAFSCTKAPKNQTQTPQAPPAEKPQENTSLKVESTKSKEPTAFQLYVKAGEAAVVGSEELVSMFITAEKTGYKTIPPQLSAHLKEQATAFVT